MHLQSIKRLDKDSDYCQAFVGLWPTSLMGLISGQSSYDDGYQYAVPMQLRQWTLLVFSKYIEMSAAQEDCVRIILLHCMISLNLRESFWNVFFLSISCYPLIPLPSFIIKYNVRKEMIHHGTTKPRMLLPIAPCPSKERGGGNW